MENYPTIQFILRFGNAFAILVALLPLAASVFAVICGVHWVVFAGGALTSIVLGVLMKSYVELVRIIADMLIPR